MSFTESAAVYAAGFADGLKPDPELWIDDWSQAHAYIPTDGNAEGGKYSLTRTPYAAEVLRVLSPAHPTRRVVVMGASQMLKTQCAMNWLMASVDAAPANILALMPSGDLAARISNRIAKTAAATPRVRDLFVKPRSRDGKNTESTKEFRGGTLHIATAGSAANLAEVPARYGYGDEVDDWEDDLQGQGDPIDIFETRGSTYGRNRKWYYSSSPKRPRGMSKILALFEAGDQRVYEVPCPHCDHRHVLEWANLRTDEAVSSAWMVCPECGAEIEEHRKTGMLAGGRWVPTATSRDGTVSFTISQLYAPLGWTSWLDLARLHAAADAALRLGDSTKMQAFHNTRLALCYDNSRAATTVDVLRGRAEPYAPRVVPLQAFVLTADVDVQQDRLEVQVEAWGRGMEHWVIDYQVLPGSPTVAPEDPRSAWGRLDELRRTLFAHESGARMQISAFGIDSGAFTQDVYNYAAARRHLGAVIHKGASRPNKPIIATRPSQQDIDWNGKRYDGGAELWEIGTDVAKDWLFDRIEITDGPGAFHFHDQLPVEWFEQLLAERRVRRLRAGVVVQVWHKEPHVRNEALDVSVGNLAIAFKLGLHKWSALDWQRTAERFAQAATQTPPPSGAPSAQPAEPQQGAAMVLALNGSPPVGRRVLNRGHR